MKLLSGTRECLIWYIFAADFFNCQSAFTRHLRNLYLLLNDHSSASFCGALPLAPLLKPKLGTSDSWLVLMLPMGKQDQNRYRTTSGDCDSCTILLMYLSTPDLPAMTACFNHKNTVWKIHRNIRDHAESPHPKRHVLSSMTPGLGKESIRGTSKGTRRPFKSIGENKSQRNCSYQI